MIIYSPSYNRESFQALQACDSKDSPFYVRVEVIVKTL